MTWSKNKLYPLKNIFYYAAQCTVLHFHEFFSTLDFCDAKCRNSTFWKPSMQNLWFLIQICFNQTSFNLKLCLDVGSTFWQQKIETLIIVFSTKCWAENSKILLRELNYFSPRHQQTSNPKAECWGSRGVSQYWFFQHFRDRLPYET